MHSPENLRVMVVEDSNCQREMATRMLHSLGVGSVHNAENGREAIELLRRENDNGMDIVFCDLNMPEMDGLEFLRHLGEEKHQVATVIVSSLGGKLLGSAGKMAKMYDVKLLGMIEKPLSSKQIESMFSVYHGIRNKWAKPLTPEMHFPIEDILEGVRARQFEPYVQPQVDLKSNRLVGAEALARWIHPEHGIITPHAFIPQLEQSGNIDELTFLMIEKSAAFCRRCHNEGFSISVSINLSLTSLDNVSLADKITKLVKKSGTDPQHITLEITESAAMTNVGHALENLTRLCMNGFNLSIDDYGTGYSSLQQLTRIPFSELKIDKSFVMGAADNEALRIMIESSVDMARKLNVKSIAEGVESWKEWNVLKKIGCDVTQGYLFGKPMSMTAFLAFMENHSRQNALPN